jgi:hypothetical protein
MAQKKVINGLDRISMLGIGWIIKNMDLVFNTIQMAINTKVDGNKIKDMAKVHFGLQILKINWEENIQEIGKVTQSKAEELCSIKMVIDTMVCGWTVYHMVKEEWFIKMETSMKECGFKVKEVDMESSPKDVETILKDIGLMIWDKDKVHISSQKKIKFLLDNGQQIPQRQECILKFKIQLLLKLKGKNILQILTFFHLLNKSVSLILHPY